jgi:hypothetical protein
MEGTEEEKEKVKKKKKKIKKLPNPTSRLSLTEWRKVLEDFRMGYISRRVSVESSSAPTGNFILVILFISGSSSQRNHTPRLGRFERSRRILQRRLRQAPPSLGRGRRGRR